MEQADVDKVKYWQYKIAQKQKSTKELPNKMKHSKVKTPEKVKKKIHLITQSNFFSNTIEKLKGYLQESSQRKKIHTFSNTIKSNKESAICKSNQLTDLNKKAAKKESDKFNKSQQIVPPMKKSKKIAVLSQKQKCKIQKISPQKSKSKSKSRSRSLKFRKQKPKQQLTKREEEISPSAKASKKKSMKTKATTRVLQTIILPNLEDQQESSWKKRLMETMIIHKDHSKEVIEKPSSFVSNFQNWQEYQQKIFNSKKKNTSVIVKYLKGFFQSVTFNQKYKLVQKNRSNNNNKLITNFKKIVKSQQNQLLQLKQCLFNLKNSENLNQSLEILIHKVNQNIVSLKTYEYQQNLKKIKTQTNEIQQNQSKEHPKYEIIDLSNEDSLNSQSFTNKAHYNESIEDQQLKQSKQSFKCYKNIQANEQPLQNHKFNNFLNNNFNEKPFQQIFISEKSFKNQYPLNQQSNSLFIDDKRSEINVYHLTSNQKEIDKESCSDQTEKKRINQQKMMLVSPCQQSFLSNESNLLLSSNKHEVNRISFGTEEPTQKQLVSQFKVINQIKTQQSYEIKIQQEEEEQMQSPGFMRSHPLMNFELEELNEFEKGFIEHYSNQNNQTNSQYTQHKQIESQISNIIATGVDIQTKNYVFDNIFRGLIIEVAQFCLKHSQFIKMLMSQYNNENNEIYNENECFNLNQQHNQQELIQPVQISDQFICTITENILRQACDHNLMERLSRPLGVPSIVTLKCIRRLNDDDGLQFLENNQIQQIIDQEQNQNDTMVEQYCEVIDTTLFHVFQEKYSPNPENPYQLIFNRCIYDTLNVILDDFRPFGSKGIPGIFAGQIKSKSFTLQQLTKRIKDEFKRLTSLRKGLMFEDNANQYEQQSQMGSSLNLWKNDIMVQVEREFNYKEEDDTIERYELMLDIEEQIFSQQILHLHLFYLNKNTDLLDNFLQR